MCDDVEGADGYSISVNGGDWKDYAKDSKKIAKVNGKNHFKVKAKAGLSGAEKGEKAKLKVKAYAGSGDSRIESAAASKSDYPVRGIAYKLTIRISGTLKSHGGPSRTIKVKRGQVINAYGFGGGKYIFKVGKSIFYCNKIRTGNRKCVYTTKWNYSKQEAEFYVKDKGLKSKTNKLIWVNGYTQHVYLFKKSKGEWVVQDDWECATGKASAPTPTGVTGNKAIWQKLKSRHALKWWSSFSDINSFHGKHKNWSVGTPASKGCIRNPTDKAKLVYDKAKIGTKVFIY